MKIQPKWMALVCFVLLMAVGGAFFALSSPSEESATPGNLTQDDFIEYYDAMCSLTLATEDQVLTHEANNGLEFRTHLGCFTRGYEFSDRYTVERTMTFDTQHRFVDDLLPILSQVMSDNGVFRLTSERSYDRTFSISYDVDDLDQLAAIDARVMEAYTELVADMVVERQ